MQRLQRVRKDRFVGDACRQIGPFVRKDDHPIRTGRFPQVAGEVQLGAYVLPLLLCAKVYGKYCIYRGAPHPVRLHQPAEILQRVFLQIVSRLLKIDFHRGKTHVRAKPDILLQ